MSHCLLVPEPLADLLVCGLDRSSTQVRAPCDTEAVQEHTVQQLPQELPIFLVRPSRFRHEGERAPPTG